MAEIAIAGFKNFSPFADFSPSYTLQLVEGQTNNDMIGAISEGPSHRRCCGNA